MYNCFNLQNLNFQNYLDTLKFCCKHLKILIKRNAMVQKKKVAHGIANGVSSDMTAPRQLL